MTTPPSRLKDAELAQQLIAAGHSVGAPPRGAMHRTLQRLEAASAAGLLASGAGLGAAKAATHGAALLARTAATGAGGTSVVKAVASSLVAKCFASGLAVGLVAGGGAVGATIGGQALWRATQSPAVTSERATQARTLSTSQARQPNNVVLNRESKSDAPLQPPRAGEHPAEAIAMPGVTDKSVKPALGSSGATLSPELARELSLLDLARSALDRGDGVRALHWLDQHSRQFPKGQLIPEAALLRAQAEGTERRQP